MKTKLADVLTNIDSGGRPKGGIKEGEGEIPSLGAEHLNDEGGFSFKKLKCVTREFYNSLQKGHIELNDILIVKDGATTGKVSFVSDEFPYKEASINEHLFRLSINSQIAFPKYVFYYLRSSFGQKQILSDFRGATVGGISKDFINKVEFFLPPLSEQKRIAAILDKADAVRRKRQETIRLLDEFLRSVFLEMFGNPVRNEKGWEKRKIKDVIIGKPNNGIFKKNEEYGGSIPVIWVEELYQSTMLYGLKSRRLNPTTNEIKKYGLKNGDILFCRSSLKKEGVGYSNIYNGPDNLCLFECHLIRISPDKSKINPFFLNYLLRYESMRKVIIERSNTVTMTTIGQDKIKEIEVIVPSIDLQNEFSKLIKKIEQQKQLFEKSLNEMEINFNNLMQKAFRGEL